MSAIAGCQKMQALTRANEVRFERARLLEPIRRLPRPDGPERAARLLEDLPDALSTLYAWRFVSQIRKVPRRTWCSWLSRLRISENRPLGQLTQRQRDLLAGLIREYGAK